MIAFSFYSNGVTTHDMGDKWRDCIEMCIRVTHVHTTRDSGAVARGVIPKQQHMSIPYERVIQSNGVIA